MKRKYSCGVIVFHRTESGIEFLLVQGYGNHWGFPKGHGEANETKEETALRELSEETSITEVILIPHHTFNETYIIHRKRGPHIKKHVHYFIGEVTNKTAERQKAEIKDIGWFSYEAAREKIVSKRRDILDIVYKVVQNP